jgi:N-acetylmuramoyl-L-alanine amidase
MRSLFFIIASMAAVLAAFGNRVMSPEDAAAEALPIAVEPPWTRPDGPLKVALQAGHWKAKDAPDEQAGLRDNGTSGGGKAEWEVNLAIARRAAAILEEAGYVVDILPTTIPPDYFADARGRRQSSHRC